MHRVVVVVGLLMLACPVQAERIGLEFSGPWTKVDPVDLGDPFALTKKDYLPEVKPEVYATAAIVPAEPVTLAQVAQVSEPASMLLLGLGALILARIKRA